MIEPPYHRSLDDSIKPLSIQYLMGNWIYLARDGHKHDIIMTMSIGIIALPEDGSILLG